MLDYDGTLAPFLVDRMHACPYPGVEARLDRIDRGALVIVTGRSARELLTLFPFARTSNCGPPTDANTLLQRVSISSSS
jgi:trehalose-6-phosphatase